MEQQLKQLLDQYYYWRQHVAYLEDLSSEDPGRDLYMDLDQEIEACRQAISDTRQMIVKAGIDAETKQWK